MAGVQRKLQFHRENDLYGMIDSLPIGAFFSAQALFNAVDADIAVLCKEGSRIKAVTIGSLFLKRYKYTSLWDRFRYNFITPRPWKNFLISEILRGGEVETPEVFAALRKRNGLWVESDFLVSSAVPEKWNFVNRKFFTSLAGEDQRQLVVKIVETLCRIHKLGIIHGDPSLRNFYCRRENDDFVVGVADLDGALSFAGGKVPEYLRCREIARMITALDGNPAFPDAEELVVGAYIGFSGVTPERKKVTKYMARFRSHRKEQK